MLRTSVFSYNVGVGDTKTYIPGNIACSYGLSYSIVSLTTSILGLQSTSVYLFMCLYDAKYLENYQTYRNEKKTKDIKMMIGRSLA